MDKVKDLKPAELPNKELIIELLESALEEAKKGDFYCLAIVGVATGNRFINTMVCPARYGLNLIGALELAKTETVDDLLEEYV